MCLVYPYCICIPILPIPHALRYTFFGYWETAPYVNTSRRPLKCSLFSENFNQFCLSFILGPSEVTFNPFNAGKYILFLRKQEMKALTKRKEKRKGIISYLDLTHVCSPYSSLVYHASLPTMHCMLVCWKAERYLISSSSTSVNPLSASTSFLPLRFICLAFYICCFLNWHHCLNFPQYHCGSDPLLLYP